jgi:hypothetical protein
MERDVMAEFEQKREYQLRHRNGSIGRNVTANIT